VGSALVLVISLVVSGVMWTRDEGEPVAGPTGSPTATPTTATSSAAPTPTTPPPSTSSPAVPASSKPTRLRAKEFAGNWRYAGRRAHYLGATNHSSCSSVETGSLFTDNGCRYTVEWRYSARDGAIATTFYMLVFDKEKHAARFTNGRKDISQYDIEVDRSRHASAGQFAWKPVDNVLLLAVSTSPSVGSGDLEDFNQDLIGDRTLDLLLRRHPVKP